MLLFNKVCLFNSTNCMEVAVISALAQRFQIYYISLMSIVNGNREKVSSNRSLNTMKGVSLSVEPIFTMSPLIPTNTFFNFLIPVLNFRLDFEIRLVLYETVLYIYKKKKWINCSLIVTKIRAQTLCSANQYGCQTIQEIVMENVLRQLLLINKEKFYS